jgi:hypothetical protein
MIVVTSYGQAIQVTKAVAVAAGDGHDDSTATTKHENHCNL